MKSLQPLSCWHGGPPFEPQAKPRNSSGDGCAATGCPSLRSQTVARRSASAPSAATDQQTSASRSTAACPIALIVSVQREDEHVARCLQLVVLHRMEVPTARLHGEILLRSDRIGHRRALERRANVEPPELFEL